MTIMQQAVFLNGRFLGQALTGVQRFAAEITTAIDGLAAVGAWPRTTILVPRDTASPNFSCLARRELGRLRGHAWEQAELGLATRRGGTLVNLGNTAPLLAGGRQVVVIHDAGVFDTPESYSLRFRAGYKTLHHGLARSGARIVTVSRFSRDRIAARLHLDPARIGVIYEGAEHVLRTASDPGTLERHGLRRGRFALVVGSLVAHKNLDALHQAMAALERRGIVVAVAGGSNRQVFQGTAAAASNERRLGRVTDGELRALYENAACLLFPSRYEGFGLPTIEAMACDCPVLAMRGGAVEEICGDAALYFDRTGERTIIDTVERLLDESGLAATLRARGRQRAAELSWDAAARRLGAFVQNQQ